MVVTCMMAVVSITKSMPLWFIWILVMLQNGTSAPPLEFIRKQVLLAAKSVLCDFGILAINVISPNRSFYEKLIYEFREVFHELYEIDVRNGEDFVVVATMSPTVSSISDSEDSFVTRLRMAISGAYMDSIRKI